MEYLFFTKGEVAEIGTGNISLFSVINWIIRKFKRLHSTIVIAIRILILLYYDRQTLPFIFEIHHVHNSLKGRIL